MDIANFVQNIKFFCDKKKIKPTVACQNAGVGKTFINNMEGRGSVPSVEKVQLLAQYLGVTTSELLGETSTLRDSASRAVADVERLTVSEVELIHAYRRADQRAQMMVHLVLEPYEKNSAETAG